MREISCIHMKNQKEWDSRDIPELTGKRAIVTGANTGIGFETARVLASKGALVIMTCRNMEKGESSANSIRKETRRDDIEVTKLDLASLSSIRQFADDFRRRYDRLDLLINNAGVMMPPYSRTIDGFELQFGTNHLGHFALTGLLIDLLMRTEGSCMVAASSFAHKLGTINFDDINWKESYKRIRAYAQSKLANLLFTYELQRKLSAIGSKTIAVAVHPGWTRTNLQRHAIYFKILNPILGQNVKMGALPTLYAATSRDVRGGEYFGPGGWKELRGYPKKVESSEESLDLEIAKRLWAVSEEMTDVHFQTLNP